MYANDKSREREVKPENQMIRIQNSSAQELACRASALRVKGCETIGFAER
jgi:hypothetical protein